MADGQRQAIGESRRCFGEDLVCRFRRKLGLGSADVTQIDGNFHGSVEDSIKVNRNRRSLPIEQSGMSSSSSGKFQDHYALFGIDYTADSETIQAAYASLVEKYHPRNPETGDPDKFEAVNIAFEVLSDPALRASFDQLKGIDPDRGDPKFSGEAFFVNLKLS